MALVTGGVLTLCVEDGRKSELFAGWIALQVSWTVRVVSYYGNFVAVLDRCEIAVSDAG
jgi:hypothetical protein